jgi:hypothetical protein
MRKVSNIGVFIAKGFASQHHLDQNVSHARSLTQPMQIFEMQIFEKPNLLFREMLG